jgi:hypothetical protein
MVYIGYPVSLKEALRLCNITTIHNQEDYYEYHQEANNKIKSYLQEYKLDFYGLDKGVYVIGYHVDEYLSNMNVNMDDFLITIIQLKNKVKNNILRTKIDLSHVEIETDLEEYPIIVKNPKPYFVNYRYS